jgi:diguanylate cyclase (GGDEF)-like protein
MAQAIEELHTETSGLASTDPLTGLYNRRFFLESLQREMERSRRDGRPLAAVMLDLDGFKAVNDRYGHTVGDAALMHIGRALHSAARAGDVTARFGGDEFVALLPNCDAASLEGVMERIRRHIAELAPPRAGDGEALHVTVSAGGALLRGDDTVDSLMQRADLALFEAKNNGRNQVRLAA